MAPTAAWLAARAAATSLRAQLPFGHSLALVGFGHGRPSISLRSAYVAVILAVITAQGWRGWMGIEPTQDASAAPRKRF
jgi:hypothetical protein